MIAALATPEIVTLPPPLDAWDDGSIRIHGTRVHLGHVADLYNLGVSPEEIVDRTPVLSIEAVYGAIAYYLAHRADLDPWLEELERRGMEALREIEAMGKMPAVLAAARAMKAEQSVPALR